MALPENNILEKNADGEFVFTSYGEFLCFFHAHLDLFKKFIKTKGASPKAQEAILNELKNYMTANVKKTDHLMKYLPQFATYLKTTVEEVNRI
jgi:hypothetical protein